MKAGDILLTGIRPTDITRDQLMLKLNPRHGEDMTVMVWVISMDPTDPAAM